MQLTTRQPLYQLEELFPFLRGAAREALRLHPRREQGVGVTSSKIGGPIVWPAGEPHPICPTKSCPAVPVLQLRRFDAPMLPFPNGNDLLQLLWYPQAYEEWGYNPKIEVYWRNSKTLSADNVLIPIYENHESMFVVHECRVQPEIIVEYPYIGLLSMDEQQTIWNWEEKQDDPLAQYQYCLSTCPGTKVGGYPDYGEQDAPSWAGTANRTFEYLLALSDDEWDGGSLQYGFQLNAFRYCRKDNRAISKSIGVHDGWQ
ncbi:MAG: hypothetical protein AAGI69_03965 [Cyanobacteria bacterium P01_H01_bin.21]